MLRFSLFAILLLGLIISIQAQERFDAPPYAIDGDYAVGTAELTIEDEERPLTATVWYPADATPGEEPVVSYPLTRLIRVGGEAYRDAAPLAEGAPYPLIVFSHGSDASRVLYLTLMEHLASRGFVVIAADHPGNNVETRLANGSNYATSYALRPDDVLRQIDYAADVLNAEGGLLEGLIDTEQVGVMGHSFGGWTALSVAGGRVDFSGLQAHCDTVEGDDNTCFVLDLESEIAAARGYDQAPGSPWEATTDERIQAVVALAPWNGPVLELSEATVPTLIVVGSQDQVTIPERDAYDIYERLPRERGLMVLENAGHYAFVDQCSDIFVQFDLQYACTDPVWDMARVHDLTNHATTAFFLSTLSGDADAAAVLETVGEDFVGVTYQQD